MSPPLGQIGLIGCPKMFMVMSMVYMRLTEMIEQVGLSLNVTKTKVNNLAAGASVLHKEGRSLGIRINYSDKSANIVLSLRPL